MELLRDYRISPGQSMYKWIEAFILSCLAVFAPIKAMLAVAGILIFADLITGVWAAYIRKEKITSAGLRRTLTKACVYEAALCLGYLAEHFMLQGAIPVTKIVSGLVGLVELKSCYENLNVISGQDLLKTVIDKLGSDNK